MLYEMTLKAADGRDVLSYAKAESADAWRIAHAFATSLGEPLALLVIAGYDTGEPHVCTWTVGSGTPGDMDALNAHRLTFADRCGEALKPRV